MTWEFPAGMLALAMAYAVGTAISRLEHYARKRSQPVAAHQPARVLVQVGLLAANKFAAIAPPGSALHLDLDELNRLLPHTVAAMERKDLSFEEGTRLLCDHCITYRGEEHRR